MQALIRRATLLGAAGLFVLFFCTGAALGETDFYDFKIGGELELGWGIFIDEPSDKERGKIEEYGDWDGPFLNMNVFALSKDEDRLYELSTNGVGLDDQNNVFFRTKKLDSYTFEFEYDEIPHLYSTVHPRNDEVDVTWRSARFGLLYSPTSEWDVSADYKFTHREGEIPKGVQEGYFPDPFEFKPIAMPIDEDEHNLMVSAEMAKAKYYARISYNMSLYENEYTAIPTRIPGDTHPYLSLPPDNAAHYLTGTLGFSLPARTRINSTFSYGWLLQDDSVAQDPIVPDGFSGGSDIEVNTMQAYISATSRPIDPFTLYGSYRFYDYDDDQRTVDLPLTGESIIRHHRSPFTRHDASVEGKWQFGFPAVINLGYRFERWDRDWPQAGGDTDTHTPRIALTTTPLDWLNITASYSHSTRDGYNFDGPAEYYVVQRFNAADRERDNMSFQADINAMQNLNFSVYSSIYSDDYDNSVFGLLEDEGWSAGADMSWTPLSMLSFSVGYIHESYDTDQRVDPDLGAIEGIEPNRNLTTEDTFDTVSAAAEVKIIPNKLSYSARYSYSLGSSDFNNQRLPDLDNALHRFETYLKYMFTSCWFARIGYVFEDYNITDRYARYWKTDDLLEYDLDGYYKDATAHMIVVSAGFKF